jgi:GT2 family glycosyltransferase
MTPSTPHWSVMITSYNRPYVVEALRSVLAQDPGPEKMHIEVVDDHSTALDIESLIHQEVPQANDRVAFHRNDHNLGIYENWNNCIQRAKGRWLHILHDDDLVYPDFYRAMEAAAAAAPTIAAAFCATRFIDDHGRPFAPHRLERPRPGIFPDLFQRLLHGNAIQFASIVVRHDIYDAVGGVDPSIDYVADWDMWMRIAAKYPVWYEPQTLAAYRMHAGSETSSLIRSGRERRGFAAAADRWLHYAGSTPENQAAHARQKEIVALEGLNLAAASFARNDFWAGAHQLKAALDCSAAPAVLREITPFVNRWNAHLAKNSDPEILHCWQQITAILASKKPS